MKGKDVEIYRDDIVVYSESIEEHVLLLREVLRRLEGYQNEIKRVFDSIVSARCRAVWRYIYKKGIKPYEIKKNEVLTFRTPKCVSGVKRFLGLTGWFENFIKYYSSSTIKLTNSLKRIANNEN